LGPPRAGAGALGGLLAGGAAGSILSGGLGGLLNQFQQNWREVIATATLAGIPVPAFSASLGYYDSYRSAVLPANLLQAQRDFFGAHTYERTDKARGEFFHTDWPEVIG